MVSAVKFVEPFPLCRLSSLHGSELIRLVLFFSLFSFLFRYQVDE